MTWLGRTGGGPISKPAVGTLDVTIQVVMRAALGFVLLLTFTTSPAAVMCLQMDHTMPMAMNSAAAGTAGETSGATQALTATSRHSPSERACCLEQTGLPQATAPHHRPFPDPASAAPVHAGPQASEGAFAPPGWFDPALKRLQHLAPSLAALSISRT